MAKELFAQGKRLLLVRRPDLNAINLVWAREQRTTVQAPTQLPVLEQERILVGPHLQYRPRALYLAGTVSEAWVEEPGIVDSELAVGRIKRDHFRGEVRGDAHTLSGRKNITVPRIKDEALSRTLLTRFPELLRRAIVDPIQFDYRCIPPCLVGNDFTLFAGFQVDCNPEAPFQSRLGGTIFVHVNQRLLAIQLLYLAVLRVGDSFHESQLP